MCASTCLCSMQPARLTVAEVLRVDPHPKAGDKLRVCEVDTSFGRFKVSTIYKSKAQGCLGQCLSRQSVNSGDGCFLLIVS
jgi:hypothetical protein